MIFFPSFFRVCFGFKKVDKKFVSDNVVLMSKIRNTNHIIISSIVYMNNMGDVIKSTYIFSGKDLIIEISLESKVLQLNEKLFLFKNASIQKTNSETIA